MNRIIKGGGKTHFNTMQYQRQVLTACGLRVDVEHTSQEPAEVTCKLCAQTQAYGRATEESKANA